MSKKFAFRLWLITHILACFAIGFYYEVSNADVICADESSANTYVGVGATPELAQSAMWENCINRLVFLYEQARGELPSEQRHLIFIDSCINRTCTSIEEEK